MHRAQMDDGIVSATEFEVYCQLLQIRRFDQIQLDLRIQIKPRIF